jgi:uncharacterized protein YaaR (DUF327 family)
MPTVTMASLAEFPEWVKFHNDRKHLGVYEISKQAAKEFGGAYRTWYDRFSFIRNNNFPSNKLGEHDRERHEQFFKFIKIPFPYVPPKKNFSKKIDPNKLPCVSDPHEKYSDERVWNDLLEKHHDAPHIHINGDMSDFYSKSRFVSYTHENFSDELYAVFKRMEWLSTHWRRITMILGNHDNRTEKKIASLITSDLLVLTETNLIKYLASFFDNIDVVGERVTDERTRENVDIGFIWQYKDIVFTHIERSMKQSSSLAEQIVSALLSWGNTFKLKPFRVVVQAHNHRAMKETTGGITVILAPMAARLTGNGLHYALHPSLRGKPPQVGYTMIYLKDGKTDINETDNYLLDT